MKKLVVFYSLNGNTRLMAENIADAAGADIMELKRKEGIKSKGFMKYIWGGREVFSKRLPELLPFDKDPKSYDMIFIGTPVWACTYAPPLGTFFSKADLSKKKVALFCCHGGGKGNTFGNMRKALKIEKSAGEVNFKEPLKTNKEENIKKARDWSKTI